MQPTCYIRFSVEGNVISGMNTLRPRRWRAHQIHPGMERRCSIPESAAREAWGAEAMAEVCIPGGREHVLPLRYSPNNVHTDGCVTISPKWKRHLNPTLNSNLFRRKALLYCDRYLLGNSFHCYRLCLIFLMSACKHGMRSNQCFRRLSGREQSVHCYRRGLIFLMFACIHEMRSNQCLRGFSFLLKIGL